MSAKRLFLSSSTALVLGVILMMGGLVEASDQSALAQTHMIAGLCVVAASAAYKARRRVFAGGSRGLVLIEVSAMLLVVSVHSWAMSSGLWVQYPFEFVTVPAWGLLAYARLWKQHRSELQASLMLLRKPPGDGTT